MLCCYTYSPNGLDSKIKIFQSVESFSMFYARVK